MYWHWFMIEIQRYIIRFIRRGWWRSIFSLYWYSFLWICYLAVGRFISLYMLCTSWDTIGSSIYISSNPDMTSYASKGSCLHRDPNQLLELQYIVQRLIPQPAVRFYVIVWGVCLALHCYFYDVLQYPYTLQGECV